MLSTILRQGQKVEFPSLETERLNLRLLTLQDSKIVFKHFSDEEITRFMDIEPCKAVKEAEEIIRFHLEDSGCRWGLFDKTMLLRKLGFKREIERRDHLIYFYLNLNSFENSREVIWFFCLKNIIVR